jgi:hypothetical protein
MAYRFGRELLAHTSLKPSKKRFVRGYAFPPAEEKSLVDFHTALIAKPEKVKQLSAEETYTKVKLVLLE